MRSARHCPLWVRFLLFFFIPVHSLPFNYLMGFLLFPVLYISSLLCIVVLIRLPLELTEAKRQFTIASCFSCASEDSRGLF